MTDIGQMNIEEMVRKYDEEEVARLINKIMENNVMMLKLQKQIVKLQVMEEEKKKRQIEIRREEEKTREQEETDKWMEEYRKRNEKEKEEREEQRRVDKEWRKIKSMKRREEKKVEKEWRYQEMRERKKEENRQKAIKERKCFRCRRFGYMASYCRNREKGEPVFSNRFEVLKVRVMQKGEESGKEVAKNRRKILSEEKARRGVEKKKKKEKYLREVTVKIRLKQEEEKEVVIEALLDSGTTGLVMSEEFVMRHKFKRTKLKKLVYVRNVDSMLNYAGPIVDTVEVEIFFKRYKKRTSIDMIGGQKWSIILGMPWLGYHNPEIDWKTGEVKMTRCPDECRKK